MPGARDGGAILPAVGLLEQGSDLLVQVQVGLVPLQQPAVDAGLGGGRLLQLCACGVLQGPNVGVLAAAMTP
jgi:hypothetical protein